MENEWKPTYKQEQFLALPYTILEAFYAGAVGAGKSDVLLVYPIIHRLHENAEFKGVYFRRTFPELKNEIIPRSRRFFKPLGGKYNKTDKVWEFPSGALFFFAHCEDENDVHNYDSMQPNYVGFDELTSFTEWQYLYITLERVRTTKGSSLPAIVRAASNPGNIGHAWVRKRFIDPAPKGFKLIQGPSGIKRIYIPATVDDNPHIDPSYLKSLNALPEAEKQAKLYGNWSAYEGQVFDEFRDKHYPDEPTNAVHVIPRFDIPDWWPRIYAIDWGYAPPAMTWCGQFAVSPDKRVYLYKEQAWQKTKIEEWAPYIKEDADREQPRVIKLCQSAGQNRGQEHTILQQISEAIGHNIELTSNSPGSRIAGKMLMHEYFRWKPKYRPPQITQLYDEEHAMHLYRIRGPKEYQSYLDSFLPDEEETNLPKFQIFEECQLFINAIKSCSYDKTNPQDVAEFPGDDPYDGARYGIDAADMFFNDAESEFNRLQKREALITELKQTQDMTAFYRNARALESQQLTKPIRRYHSHA